MRLSVPSWVTPGTRADNLRFLDGHAYEGGVELLCFEGDEEAVDELEAELGAIRAMRHRFGYTVHLPSRIEAAHERIVALTANLAEGYVVHPPEADPEAFAALVDGWRVRWGDRFAVENTAPGLLEHVESATAAAGLAPLPLCVDTGHLLLGGVDPAAWLAARTAAGPVRELHLHGVADGRDHVPPEPGQPWFDALVPYLRAFTGVVNVELFSWNLLEPVLEALRFMGG